MRSGAGGCGSWGLLCRGKREELVVVVMAHGVHGDNKKIGEVVARSGGERCENKVVAVVGASLRVCFER